MSGGRVELGLGAGWFEAEHAAYGIPFPPTGERFDRLEEQLAIVTGLWATPRGRAFSFDGRRTTGSTDSPALPKPVQSPLPLIVGGAAGRADARAGGPLRRPSTTSASLRSRTSAAAYERVRAACDASRPDPASLTFSVALTTVCGGGRRRGRRAGPRRSARTSTELRTSGLAGTPAEIVDRIGALRRGRRDPGLPAGPGPRRPRP